MMHAQFGKLVIFDRFICLNLIDGMWRAFSPSGCSKPITQPRALRALGWAGMGPAFGRFSQARPSADRGKKGDDAVVDVVLGKEGR
jgi:hypothetical protein